MSLSPGAPRSSVTFLAAVSAFSSVPSCPTMIPALVPTFVRTGNNVATEFGEDGHAPTI
jgi:hypothetical protein